MAGDATPGPLHNWKIAFSKVALPGFAKSGGFLFQKPHKGIFAAFRTWLKNEGMLGAQACRKKQEKKKATHYYLFFNVQR